MPSLTAPPIAQSRPSHRPLTIAFVIKTLALPGGGAERVLADITAELAKRGHELIVISFDAPGTVDFYPLHPQIQRMRIVIGQSDRPTRAFETVARMANLRRQLVRLRPDVAVGFLHSLYIPMSFALAGSGIPLIASEHIVWGHYIDRPLEAALMRASEPFIEAYSAVTNYAKSTYPPRIARKMAVIGNPVSGGDSADVAKRGEPRRILAVGRLTEQKDHATLIDAFARIASQFPQWHLRIVGTGHLHDALATRIAKAGMASRVTLAGGTLTIGEEYRAADLFAMPSRYESFGLVTGEALGYGLPVIGFADCPGTNELILDGVNGLLVAPGDRVANLAEGLAKLIADPRLREAMAAAAPSSVERLSSAMVADDWEKLLSRIASNRADQGTSI